MVDNRRKKVAHTTDNKDRRPLPHDVGMEIGGWAGMKHMAMRQKGHVDQLMLSALQKMKRIVKCCWRLFFVEGESFLDRWLRRLGLKDC
jgi:hypothetical protein